MTISLSVCLCLLLVASGTLLVEARTKFVMNLDIYTFDKVLTVASSSSPRFAIVKFDKEHPYGDEHEAFNQFAEIVARNVTYTKEGRRVPILVGEVRMKDQTQSINLPLIERFGWKQFQLPKIAFLAPPLSQQKRILTEEEEKDNIPLEDEYDEVERKERVKLRELAPPRAQIYSVMSADDMYERTSDTISRWALSAIRNYSIAHAEDQKQLQKNQQSEKKSETWGSVWIPINGTATEVHCALTQLWTKGQNPSTTRAELKQYIEQETLPKVKEGLESAQGTRDAIRKALNEADLTGQKDEKIRDERRKARKNFSNVDKKAFEYYTRVLEKFIDALSSSSDQQQDQQSVAELIEQVHRQEVEKMNKVRGSDVTGNTKAIVERKLNILAQFISPCTES